MKKVDVSPPQAVLDLFGPRPILVEPLDARGEPWLLRDGDWLAVLRRLPPRLYPPEANFAHVAWLHRFLDRLAPTGFPAPRPLRMLNGASLAIVDGAIWEVLSYLPGRALGWDPSVRLESAGALLGAFHEQSLAISPAEQRPGALPLEDCHPRSAKSIADTFHRDLADIGHQSAARCVLHADCTSANMLVDGDPPAVVGMVDFTLALLGPPESDISFALWVTGRSAQPAVGLDAARVRAFVAGYHAVRPLSRWAIRAIPLYLVGRGLQMLVRGERLGGPDQKVLERVSWLAGHRDVLEDIVASVVGGPRCVVRSGP
jgi:Ser/Thr protein kinase RdoA (MazF antagonist)